MSKYQKLTEYLSDLEGDSFTTNFAALEEILGFKLPSSAREYNAWWANQGRGQSLAWQSAGWKTMDVSPKIKTVTFVRSGAEEEDVWAEFNRQISIKQAKAGLALTFDVEPDQVEITIRA